MFTKRKFLTVLFGLFFIGFSLGSAPMSVVAAKAKYHSKVGCKKGTFHDPRKGGECWSCPRGYSRSASAVTKKKACHKSETFKKAKHKRNAAKNGWTKVVNEVIQE